MMHINIVFTRLKRLASPEPLPELTQAEAKSWFAGLWCGCALGGISGAGAAVLVLQGLGRIN